MNGNSAVGLIAVDVGNSCIKLGWYPSQVACTADANLSELTIAGPRLPPPDEVATFLHLGLAPSRVSAEISHWLDQLPADDVPTFLATVCQEATPAVIAALVSRGHEKPHVLQQSQLPIEVQVEQPAAVGIDRLLSAIAANKLRDRERPAIVVSLGTACTVNLISETGSFEGGAILPGIAMSAAALHRHTSALPQLTPDEMGKPDEVVGKSTAQAISSGLHWGLVGAVTALTDQMTERLEKRPDCFVTGGEASRVFAYLAGPERAARLVPNMVLGGIRVTAEELL